MEQSVQYPDRQLHITCLHHGVLRPDSKSHRLGCYRCFLCCPSGKSLNSFFWHGGVIPGTQYFAILLRFFVKLPEGRVYRDLQTTSFQIVALLPMFHHKQPPVVRLKVYQSSICPLHIELICR
ncbi:hypothetical protein AVEN_197576-1 [Araneus ventricosus]|uniref:Uncharacterized protein n=1 Tax=Araneus ventricosus TaxID=182803 RepID=A0A4Y2R2S6_ARAVE|nr:hypothetical protein AVEN_197576-1 [Araneus ventricosus]